ncbi:MAG: hypothetical protein WCH46_10675 [bacterium]
MSLRFRAWAIVWIFVGANAPAAFAQFSGTVSFGGFHTTNSGASTSTTGNSSSAPDNVITPSLDLLYSWDVTNYTGLKFEATYTPNYYTASSDRTYTRTHFGVEGNFYLSNLADEPPILPAKVATVRSDSVIQSVTTTLEQKKTKLTPTPQVDKSALISTRLAHISELLDSFDIDEKGLSSDSIDIASDLKDSVSESVLALSQIISSEPFTESIGEVVGGELTTQLRIFQDVPIAIQVRNQIESEIAEATTLLKSAVPVDEGILVKSTESSVDSFQTNTKPNDAEKKLIIAQAIQHAQTVSPPATISSETSPTLTLVNSQTAFTDFSSNDISLRTDLQVFSKKTTATQLSIPITFDRQDNRSAYTVYTNTLFDIKPRLDYYFGTHASTGLTLGYSVTSYPLDSAHLSDANELLARVDCRLEIMTNVVLVPELAFGSKNYAQALKYSVIVPVKGHPLRPDTVVTILPKTYTHYFGGIGLMFFPTKNLSVGIVESMSRSSNLRPYIYDSLISIRTRGTGSSIDDEYSYDLTRESIFLQWKPLWDIVLAIDFAYENQHYASIEIKRRLLKNQTTNIQRDDKGTLTEISLTREWDFDSRLIGIFTTFTPTIDVSSTNITSSLKQFSYKDVSTTLSLEFGF